MNPRPIIDKDGLLKDSVTVAEAHITDAESRILNFTASPAMVLDWYHSTDPLREAGNKVELDIFGLSQPVTAESAAKYVDFEFKTPMLNETAGLTLVAGVVEPEINLFTGKQWLSKFYGEKYQNLTIQAQKKGERFLEQLLNNLPKNLGADDFQKMYIALDCFASAGNRYGYLAHSEELCKHHPYMTREEVVSKYVTYHGAAMEISRILFNHKDRFQDEVSLKVAYDAGLFWSSIMLMHPQFLSDNKISESSEDNLKVARHNGYLGFEQAIRSYFIEHPFKSDRKVIKGEDKGLLHEALWLMDINYLLQQPNSGLNAPGYAFPTFPRADKPEINYPTYRRAYDIHIALSSNGRTIPVQLKASSNGVDRGSEYHPNIYVVSEDNFQEVDVRRLSAKLTAYKQWVESGFSPDSKAMVDKYLLPSAVAFMEKAKEVESMCIADYKMQKLPTAGLDRAAKRRLRRAIRNNG